MMIESNIKNTIYDRLDQVKEFTKTFESYSEDVSGIIKSVQADPKTEAKHKKNIQNFREIGMKLELIRQSIASLTSRLVELYTLAKISSIDIELEERDLGFLEHAMKEGSLDLFRVEKGELKIVDEQYHDMAMEQVRNVTKEQSTQVYQYLLNVKAE